MVNRYMDNCGNSGANTCEKTRLLGRVVFIRYRTNALRSFWMIHNKRMERIACAGAQSIEFLTYQLSTVGYWPTVALTGNGELGFDSKREPEKRLPHLRKAAGAQITQS